MAGRGRNQPQPQALQGADPALVQILQMMQNRDANRDNSRKQFLMFPKESFTGEDKKKAKSHWAEFSKYLDYQDQQVTIPCDLAHLPEIKSMFKLTLQDIALGWFETESPTWLTEDQMKQAFLKRFNPWQDKCDAIRNMKAPKSVKECHTFCGMVNFLSTFCKNLRQLLIPIYELTKKHARFVWTDKHQKAFEEIKQLLVKPPVLRMVSGNDFSDSKVILVELLPEPHYINGKITNGY